MNKNIALYLAAAIAIGFLAYAFKDTLGIVAPQGEEAAIVKIGVFPASPNAHYPVFVAQKKGFFAEEGLTGELVEINPGLSVAALLAHEIDYGQYLKEVVAAGLKDAPVKVVAVYPQEPALALVGQPGLELKDIHAIGVNFPQDANHFHALQVIHDEGLDAKITTSNSQALLASKQTDAIVLNLSAPFRLEAEGYKILKIIQSDIVSGFTARSETVAENPEQVAGVIRAREKAFAFIKENPEEAKELLYELLKLEKNEVNGKVVDGIYAALAERPEVPASPENAVNTLIKIAKAGEFETFEDIDRQVAAPEDIVKAFDLRAMPTYD